MSLVWAFNVIDLDSDLCQYTELLGLYYRLITLLRLKICRNDTPLQTIKKKKKKKKNLPFFEV